MCADNPLLVGLNTNYMSASCAAQCNLGVYLSKQFYSMFCGKCLLSFQCKKQEWMWLCWQYSGQGRFLLHIEMTHVYHHLVSICPSNVIQYSIANAYSPSDVTSKGECRIFMAWAGQVPTAPWTGLPKVYSLQQQCISAVKWRHLRCLCTPACGCCTIVS